jgi:hypothetical protein
VDTWGAAVVFEMVPSLRYKKKHLGRKYSEVRGKNNGWIMWGSGYVNK